MDHIDKLALQQQHDDHIEGAELMRKLITVMEFLNNKDINVNLPENLRISSKGVTQVEGDVKAIVANAIEVEKVNTTSKILSANLKNDEKTKLLELLKKVNDFHYTLYTEYKNSEIKELLHLIE